MQPTYKAGLCSTTTTQVNKAKAMKNFAVKVSSCNLAQILQTVAPKT